MKTILFSDDIFSVCRFQTDNTLFANQTHLIIIFLCDLYIKYDTTVKKYILSSFLLKCVIAKQLKSIKIVF